MLSELNAPPSPLPPVTPASRLASTMIARNKLTSMRELLKADFDKQLTSHPPKNIESKILREHIKKEREAAKAGKRSYYLKKSELCERKLVNKYNELKVKSTRFKGMLVNIDTNNGDPQVGWTCIVASGGFNFDAKLSVPLSYDSCSVKKWNSTNIGFFCGNRQRESTNVEDMFVAHISEIDTLAHGLHNVAKLIEMISSASGTRASGSEIGALIEERRLDMLEKKALECSEPTVPSSKQVNVTARDSISVRSIDGAMSIALDTVEREDAKDGIVGSQQCIHGWSIHLIKERRNSCIVPIGSLQLGVCRHRADLMKYLCDRANPPIPCELVRGHLDYTPHAWNIVPVKKRNGWVRMIVDACYPTNIKEETDPEYFCR
ncbi:Testis intracellular mediator protein [Zea mays]|uniref:rRNA biogenesis protein RRP36 n=1 Tax=Zea mays TaxID=4577 RepID=A0A1D6DZ75_MAIZE|nr:Testis intracellular mediator protein [Zea mays]